MTIRRFRQLASGPFWLICLIFGAAALFVAGPDETHDAREEATR